MKKGLIALSVATAFSLGGLLWAHEGAQHVRGRVAKIDATHVEVTTRDGKTVSVALTPETKFFKMKAAAAAADVKEGMRVIIDVAKKGEALEATEVRIGVGHKPEAPPASPTPTPAPTPKP